MSAVKLVVSVSKEEAFAAESIARMMPNLLEEIQLGSVEAPTPKGFYDMVAHKFGNNEGFPPRANGNVLENLLNFVPKKPSRLADIIMVNPEVVEMAYV